MKKIERESSIAEKERKMKMRKPHGTTRHITRFEQLLFTWAACEYEFLFRKEKKIKILLFWYAANILERVCMRLSEREREREQPKYAWCVEIIVRYLLDLSFYFASIKKMYNFVELLLLLLLLLLSLFISSSEFPRSMYERHIERTLERFI